MPITDNVKHMYEPTSLMCGQAVISMLTGEDINDVIKLCGTDRETTLSDMKRVFKLLSVNMCNERKVALSKADLPDIALLSLETPRCWHWSLYFKGTFFDPEHGVLEDFPISNRKYFWEIKD